MADRIEFGTNNVLEGNSLTIDGKTVSDEEYREYLKKKKLEEVELLKKLNEAAKNITIDEE
jgi:hypothetical protein